MPRSATQLQRDGLDSVSRRTVVSKSRKLALIARAAGAALRPPPPLIGVPALPAVQFLVDAAAAQPLAAAALPAPAGRRAAASTSAWPGHRPVRAPGRAGPRLPLSATMAASAMSQNLPVVLIEVVLIFGGVLAFGWWQLRDLKKERERTRARTARGG